MPGKKKVRKGKVKEEKVGTEKEREQQKDLPVSENYVIEVSKSSPSIPLTSDSPSPSDLNEVASLPPRGTFDSINGKQKFKRDSFFQRSMRTINTGSTFIRNEKKKISVFISEATQNTVTTVNEVLGNIRSITLQSKTIPSHISEGRNIKMSFIEEFEEEDYIEQSQLKEAIQYVVMSITFRLFSILLIFIHIAVLVAGLSLTPKGTTLPLVYRIFFLLFGLFFLADVLFQVFLEGAVKYFSSIINTIDLLSILSFLMVDIVYLYFDIGGIPQIPTVTFLLKTLRLFVLIKVFQLASEKNKLEKAARKLVSENKRRYRKDGFDLDLTYITDNVIAMSFPSSGSRSLYRNPIKEVARFLDTKHKDHYKIYNLCSEKTYNPSHFHNRVERFPIDDHNVPTIIDMLKFVDSVFEWMEKDPKNIIVVHCMGGKGRTGTMICIWLIASEHFNTAKESLEYFGKRRTDTASSSKYQGVETPSQRRYIEYFALIKNKYLWAVPQSKTLKISSIIIHSIRGIGKGNGTDLKIVIIVNKKIVHTCVCSSLKSCQALPKLYEKCPFFFCFNTAFIENNRLYLSRNELDNPHKQKTWHIYLEDFAVELLFSNA
uniref:Phosphatidylinositol-3,4,5-trisphosphate 3-phosphatase n=1 Tax=Sarcophilus harrisii TaxID=9305 RepID=A0A7N4NRX9_SARHA